MPKATQEINTGARFISSSRISSFQSSSFTLRVKKRILVMQERNQPRIASRGWRREGGRKGEEEQEGGILKKISYGLVDFLSRLETAFLTLLHNTLNTC